MGQGRGREVGMCGTVYGRWEMWDRGNWGVFNRGREVWSVWDSVREVGNVGHGELGNVRQGKGGGQCGTGGRGGECGTVVGRWGV